MQSSKLWPTQAQAHHRRSRSARLFAIGLCTTLFPFGLPSLHATSATWIGPADDSLNTGANWDTASAAFGDGDTMTFNSASSLGTLTWSSTLGAGFGASLGLDILHQGAGTLTLDSSTNSVINLGDIQLRYCNPPYTLRNSTGADSFTNNSSNLATIGSGISFQSGAGSARVLTFDGSGDWLVKANLQSTNTASSTSIVKSGAGTLTLDANQGFTAATNNITINSGTLTIGTSGRLGSGTYSAAVTNNGTLNYNSTLSQTMSGVISGSGTLNQGAGSLTLTGTNTYTGATTITGGSLTVGGSGAINASSGIVINGAGAKYVHTSSVASDRAITVTQGTLDGTGTVGGVTVGNGTGGIVANGNGGSGSLTVGSLTFAGAGTLSVADDGSTSTAGIIVGGALVTTVSNGLVTINASQLSWNNGVVYNLVSFGSFSGSLSDFIKGTISGLTSRQSSSLVMDASTIGLQVVGDTPKWTGADGSQWQAGTTGASGNWKLITADTATDYIEGDVVLFDDTASNTTVTISSADVNPSVVNFDNSTKDYTVSGSSGIASGALSKSGTGSVTISTVNSYAGGTTISAGTLALSGSGTLGSSTGALGLSGGTLDLGGTSQTVGATTLTGAATIQNGTLTASSIAASNASGNAVISANLAGSGGVTKSSAGTLTLSGTNTYSGATAITGGTLAAGGAGALSAASAISLGGGSLDLGGTSQSSGAVTVSVATAGATISNGTLTPTSLTVTSTSGTVGISAGIAGATGITISSGGTTVALSGNNTFTGTLNLASNSTVQVTGGTNTGGGAIAFNSFGTTFTMSGGSYVTSGVTSSGNSDFRQFNLNGGTFQSNGNIFASGAAIAVVINGGTFRVGNAAGVTLFDANNTVEVQGGGATLDTTLGNLTIGTNSSSANAVAISVTGGGTLGITGGNTLASRITGNGALSIQDGSTWNLAGSIDDSAASLDLGSGAVVAVTLSGVGIDNATALLTLSGALTETTDGGSYTFDFNGFNFDTAGSYKLVSFSSVGGTLSGSDFGSVNASFGAGLTGQFVINSDNLSLVIGTVPEPSVVAACAGLVALGFAGLRRRKRA